MEGYWNKPEETAAAFAGGWLHTGDVARADAEGFLTIVDRKKDMIVSGGFNLFPREIEDVISTHPAVGAVAVIGVPDERWGEAVKAVVVLRPDQKVDPDELMALVKERKGSAHAPKSVDFVDAIPVSGLGKPDKKALRGAVLGRQRPPGQLRWRRRSTSTRSIRSRCRCATSARATATSTTAASSRPTTAAATSC